MKDIFGIPRTALDVFEMLPEGTLCEVIDNALIFQPPRTTTHQEVLGDILYGLYETAEHLGTLLPGPCDVYLDNGQTIVTPDIFFIHASRDAIVENIAIKGSPDLVIEVLSENKDYDKATKLEVYERNLIPEYFIIDPKTKEVWHYLLVDNVYGLKTSVAGELDIQQLGLKINF